MAAVSSDSQPDWMDLFTLAKLIPRLCHNINRYFCIFHQEQFVQIFCAIRVVWVFGGLVQGPIEDITPTCLTCTTLSTLREADSLANSVLLMFSFFIDIVSCISQMPIVLVPVHFDRAVENKIQPSCQRSIVIRTFITSDFMTGIAAVPGQDIPTKVLLC